METTLTPKNLQDVFDNILAQYNAIKTAQNNIYGNLRAYNLDFFSHFLGKPKADIQVPITSSIVDFQRSIRDLAFSYSSMASYSQFKTLFTALDTYFRTESALIDKTINGFLSSNNMKVTDEINALYKGIIGRYLQARNLLVAKDRIIYKTTWDGTSMIVVSPSPSSTEFNNTSYTATSIDGITYAPFPMKIVPSAEITGVSFRLNFTDGTNQVFDYSSTNLTTDGVIVSSPHSGVTGISIVSGTLSNGISLSVSSNFISMTFETPTGWGCYGNFDDVIQCYIGTDITGTRIRIGSKYYFPKNSTVNLYLQLNPTALGSAGEFVVNGTTLDPGTPSGIWTFNTFSGVLTSDFTISAQEAGS